MNLNDRVNAPLIANDARSQQFNQTNTTFNKNASVCVVFAHRARSTYHFNALYTQTSAIRRDGCANRQTCDLIYQVHGHRQKQTTPLARLCTFVLLNLACTTAHIYVIGRTGFLALLCVGLSLEHNRAHIYD